VDDRQRPGKIRDEDDCSLQRRDEDRLEPFVVGGDLRTELLDASLDLPAREVDLADPLGRA
jgi:hypothetical protein